MKSDGGVRGADFAGDPARFLFEDAESEAGRGPAVEKILLNPLLQAAASLALRDMHKIVDEQLAVAPRFRANDEGVAESDATRFRGDDTSAPGCLSQFAAFRERNPFNEQNSNPLTIHHPGPARISQVLRTEWSAVGENEFFLGFCPLVGQRQKVFECFLINHVGGGALATSDKRVKGVKGQGKENI